MDSIDLKKQQEDPAILGGQATTLAKAQANPGVLMSGPGSFQALTTPAAPTKSIGTIDSGAADAYVGDLSQKKSDIEGRQVMEKLLNNSSVDQNFVQGQLRRTETEADSLLGGREPNTSTFETRVNRAFDPQKTKIQEEADLERQKLNEQQHEQSATTRTALYRRGTTGTPFAADVMGDLQRDQTREQDVLNKAEREAINNAWDASLRGELNIAKQYSDRADEIKKQIELQKSKAEEDQYKVLQTQKLAMDVGKDWATTLAKNSFNSGVVPSDIEFKTLDKTLGLTPGSSVKQYNVALADQERQSAKDDAEFKIKSIESADKLHKYLDSRPLGEKVSIGDYNYVGTGKGLVKSGVEISKSTGEGQYYEYDPSTKRTTIVSMGTVGFEDDGSWSIQKDDDGHIWRVNVDTGKMLPMQPGVAQLTNAQIYPDGKIGPALPGHEANAGQCGAACNFWYGQSILGDSFEQKKQALSNFPQIKGDEIQSKDTFLMTSGDTGHVGVVGDTWIDKNTGKRMFTRTESNMVPPGAGLLSNSEVMAVDDPRIKLFSRVPTPNLPIVGTDSKVTLAASSGPTFGAKKAELLSVSEAKDLGVPFGTTQAEAARMGIRPGSVGSFNFSIPSEDEFLRSAEKESFKGKGAYFDPQEAQKIYASTYQQIPVYQDAARNVALGLTDKKQASFISDVNDALKNGDFIKAQDKLKKAALDTAESVTTQQVRGRDSSIRALTTINEELQKFVDKNGNTNVLTGSYEEARRKVGTVSNPELRKIATKITAALADYRRAISGAAFTESEKADYAAMFPSILNTEALNSANIQALIESQSQANETFYRQQLGNENYDSIFAH